MKKRLGKLRKPIIITILALLVVSYYIYLTHRNVNNDDKMTSNSDVSEITSRDLEMSSPGLHSMQERFLMMSCWRPMIMNST